MSLFSHSQAGELILILDVQSSIVRGSLVVLKRGAQPNVVFTYNANVPWKAHTDSSYLIKVTLHAVTETVDACVRSLHGHVTAESMPQKISAVHYALSSPWIVSEAKLVSSHSPKDIQLSRAYVESIIAKERAKLAPDAEVTIIEQKIFDVRLNGYSVGEWVGKAAKDIDVSYTMSVAGTRMMQRFREVVVHVAPPRAVSFHSSLLLQSIGMRIIMPDRNSYALIHVHGELSDVAVMDRKGAVFFGSFPFGVRTLTRKIAQSTDTDIQAADSLLALYVGGHIDETHGKASLDAVRDIAVGWTTELTKLLVGTTAPPLMMVSAFAHDDFFVELLKAAHPKSRIEPLSIDEVSPRVAFGSKSERRRLTGLYAIAIDSLNV